MISLSFIVSNPWNTTFKSLWCRAYSTPFKEKFIEVQLTKESTVVSFIFNWTVRRDHAGLALELALFGYCFNFNFYNSQHWNPITNSWHKDKE